MTGLVDGRYLESKLSDLVPGVIRGYSHSESSVRKASVFCLVAIHAVVGDTLRKHLSKLSSSQVSMAWLGVALNLLIHFSDQVVGTVHQTASTGSH